MLNTPSVRNPRRFRLAATLILFSVSLVVAVEAFAPRSGAKPPVQVSSREVKRSRPAFVPGQVLVRYRNEGVAKTKGAATTLARADGQSLPMQVERRRAADRIRVESLPGQQ